MTRCELCGRDELFSFTCRNCGRTFCAGHRLPERHDCPMIEGEVIPMKRVKGDGSNRLYAPSSSFRTSRTELLHLAIGVGVFITIMAPEFLRFGAAVMIAVAGLSALAFILHELAHKVMAQQHGLWSEFRLDPLATLVSLVTLLSPFKIIAPGAVVVFGPKISRESMGKIAVSGPLINMIMVMLFMFLAQFSQIFRFAAILNANLAVFNLFPFSVLDGRKVLDWNKKSWFAVFASSIILWLALRTVY